ncbi:MAG: hypothetical protein SOV27_00680 [Eubacteriales bacterium]|nr:hypothetical protein [Eubacteriales bacterium]
MNIESEIIELKKRIEKLEKLLKVTEPSEKPTNRDKTHYMFENKILPKNRLVLAVIKKYVSEHNPTFEELQSVFDKSLQGSRNVVETMGNAQKISDCAKRYFVKDAIPLKDGTLVVVCTQWGIFNIVKFEKLAESLGYNINKV